MARSIRKLSDRKANGRLAPGRHSDGGGLYLNVTDTGARSWLFMWKVGRRRREMGLGSLHSVPLASARELAEKARRDRALGRDPIEMRDAAATKTFAEAADELIANMSSNWRSAKHCTQWEMTLRTYCLPIRGREISAIETDDVLRVLRPMWQAKSETASRLRGRIERVLDYAKARGWRSGENPARWRGHLDAILPRRAKLSRGHYTAMAFTEVPAFMGALRKMRGVTPRALEFTVLTAARTKETLGAQWSEIDRRAGIWTVPAERMKGAREHRVPLSDRALEILRELEESRISEFVFPGSKRGAALAGTALISALHKMGITGATVHGFRSSLRDWAGETTEFPRETAEAALAHLVGDETERAYRRGDALEKRRKLMDAWAAYCTGSDGRVAGGANHNRLK